MPAYRHPIASKLPNVGTTIFTVMSRLAQEHNAINLSQGFPDFECAPALRALIPKYFNAGLNQYPPMAGVPALREAIAEKIEHVYGRRYDANTESTVTAGATQALLTAILCAVHPGDEVIVVEPTYDSYLPSIELAGGKPVFVTLEAPDYAIPFDRLAAAITPKTRLILINTPHNPTGTVWRPAECDVSIRPGWFSHPADDAKLRSVDNLVGLYFSSVGRNGKLLLNVPPMRNGLLHAVDVARLTAFRQRLTSMFERDLARDAKTTWQMSGRTATLELALPRSSSVTIVRLEEDITQGQRVASYSVMGESGGVWKTLSRGTTIGHAKLDRFLPTQVGRIRVSIEEAIGVPRPLAVRVYGPG